MRFQSRAGAEVERRAVDFQVVRGDEDFAAREVERELALPTVAVLAQVKADAAVELLCRLHTVGAVVAEVVKGDAARDVQPVGVVAQGEVGAQRAACLDAARVQEGGQEGKWQFGGDVRAAGGGVEGRL